jgi:hypothetical protein
VRDGISFRGAQAREPGIRFNVGVRRHRITHFPQRKGKPMFSDEELLTLHWLANNGFQKLLVLAKKGLEEFKLENKQNCRRHHRKIGSASPKK